MGGLWKIRQKKTEIGIVLLFWVGKKLFWLMIFGSNPEETFIQSFSGYKSSKGGQWKGKSECDYCYWKIDRDSGS